MSADAVDEGKAILEVLAASLPEHLDGREAILTLKREGSRNWRQMEWLGWWFEHFAFGVLESALGGRIGPRYGNTVFDYQRSFVWDFKAHPLIGATGSRNASTILNDAEATGLCIEEHGGIGYVIAEGCATFDETGEFKAWHDVLKGGVSSYEKDRVARGAPSRRRKAGFRFTGLSAFFFDDQEDLDQGMADGWAAGFQKGMRNADGSPRREKFSIRPADVPTRYVVEHRILRESPC